MHLIIVYGYFESFFSCFLLLIISWVSETTGYFILGIILTFIFAFTGQAFIYFHLKYFPSIFDPSTKLSSLISNIFSEYKKQLLKLRVISTLCKFIDYWWAAIDMLLLMTYNVYVIIALSLGIASGYYLFLS